jgi:hypothetical protein
MTPVSERDSARARGGMRRFATFALALAVAACFSGVDKNATQPTGVIGPTGTGGGGSGGIEDQGSYSLSMVNDSAVPFTLANDSVSGVGTNGDTTRVFIAAIDSSFLYLNSDTTAEEIDYLTIRDARTAVDSSFNRTITFGDTTFGGYTVSGSTVTVTLSDTVSGTVTVTYTATGSTLTGTVAYVLYNTDDQIAAAGDATYEYAYSGPPLEQRVVSHTQGTSKYRLRVGPLMGAAASHVRVWRPPVWTGPKLLHQCSAPLIQTFERPRGMTG